MLARSRRAISARPASSAAFSSGGRRRGAARPGRCRRARRAFGERAPIDDRAAVGQVIEAVRHRPRVIAVARDAATAVASALCGHRLAAGVDVVRWLIRGRRRPRSRFSRATPVIAKPTPRLVRVASSPPAMAPICPRAGDAACAQDQRRIVRRLCRRSGGSTGWRSTASARKPVDAAARASSRAASRTDARRHACRRSRSRRPAMTGIKHLDGTIAMARPSRWRVRGRQFLHHRSARCAEHGRQRRASRLMAAFGHVVSGDGGDQARSLPQPTGGGFGGADAAS